MRQRIWIYLSLAVLALPGLLQAHGMVWEIAPRQTVVILATYDDGEAMAYAAVKVFAPGESQIEHQNGRTDKNGNFAFMPDAPGPWRIILDGGMGHVINTTFDVDDALTVSGGTVVSNPISRAYGITGGLGFIFGLTGVGLYLHGRRAGSRPGRSIAPGK
jgi:nickel transport protein